MTPYFDPAVVPRDDVMKLKMREGLLALLHLDSRFAPTLFDFNEPWKIDILAFMNDNYMYELSIEELAHYTGRSPATFKRDFRKISDLTPAKWIMRKRLEAAHARCSARAGARWPTYIRPSGSRIRRTSRPRSSDDATASRRQHSPSADSRSRANSRSGRYDFCLCRSGRWHRFCRCARKNRNHEICRTPQHAHALGQHRTDNGPLDRDHPLEGACRLFDGYLWTLFAVCIVYMADFFVRMASAASPSRYLRRNILILLLSIPYQNILHWATGGAVGHDLSIVLSAVTLLRAFLALYMIVRWLVGSSVGRLFAAYIVTLVVFTYLSGLIFYEYEAPVNDRLDGFGNALWWAWMNVTTVGAAIFPVTAIGRQGGVRAAADARHGHVPRYLRSTSRICITYMYVRRSNQHGSVYLLPVWFASRTVT